MSSKHKKQRGGQRQVRPQPGQQNLLAPKRPIALVDVILPIYGDWSYAERAVDCLEAAFNPSNDPYRIIIVDNGTPPWSNQQGQSVSPQDQAIGIKSKLRPQDAFFRLEENRGYPGGMNFAASKGNSPLILLLTSDVWLFPGAAVKLIREMDNPDVGVAGPMLIFPPGATNGPAERIQHAGLAFNMAGKPFHVFLGWTPDNPKANKKIDVAAVTGACFVTRRSLWEQVGGFFVGYGAGTYEDVDYCFAIRSGGHKAVYVPEARGYHAVGGSISTGSQHGGFNLPLNETIFRGRWANMLAWDEWRRW